VGEVDLASMFWQKFGPPSGTAGLTWDRAYTDAEPPLAGRGPWSQNEVKVYGGPRGAGGEPLREVALSRLPQDCQCVDLADEALIYREYPDVPLVVLPQFGPGWASAYSDATDAGPLGAHTRLDIKQWVDIDAV
jgi:hypothetical protein